MIGFIDDYFLFIDVIRNLNGLIVPFWTLYGFKVFKNLLLTLFPERESEEL